MPAPVSDLLFAQLMPIKQAPLKQAPVNKNADQSAAAANNASNRSHDKAPGRPEDKASFEESFARESRKANGGVETTSESKSQSSSGKKAAAKPEESPGETKGGEEQLLAAPIAQPVQNPLQANLQLGKIALPNAQAAPLLGLHGLTLGDMRQAALGDASTLTAGQKLGATPLSGFTAALQPLAEGIQSPLAEFMGEFNEKLTAGSGSAEKLTAVAPTSQVQQPLAQSLFNNNIFRAANLSKTGGLEAWQMLGADTSAEVPTSSLAADAASATRPVGVNSLPMLGIGADGTAKFQLPVNVTFGQPQWAGAVAERSAMLFSQNINNAELLLDPPELGRMTVQIQVHNDQASVTFTSANAGVRDALDQSGQRLRDLLAEQGIDLVNVDVSDQSPSHEGQGDSAGEHRGGSNLADAEDTSAVELAVNLQSGIDHYV